MKLYLIKKHFSISLLCSIIIMFFGWISGAYSSLLESLLKSAFFGCFVGCYLVYYFFDNRNIWTLYNNLRISKFIFLFISSLSFLILSTSFAFLINYSVNGI